MQMYFCTWTLFNTCYLIWNIFHALRAHSISYFHEKGGFNGEGAYLQLELEKGVYETGGA